MGLPTALRMRQCYSLLFGVSPKTPEENMILAICSKVEAWTKNHRVAGTPTAHAIGAGAYGWE